MPNSRDRISITDVVIEVAVPVLIIGLLWSLVVFAITLKGVYYPGQEGVLTTVFFLYVMGTVMINRLVGLYGESDKAVLYGVLLVLVMAVFAVVYSSRHGAISGGADAGSGILPNLLIVGIVGFGSYQICRESFFDIKNSDDGKSDVQLRAELREKRDWYRREVEEEERKKRKSEKGPVEAGPPAEFSDKPPGIWIIYFTMFSMVIFAVGQRLLPQDNGALYVRAFNCLLANLLCALSLLLLVTLSKLRFRCWEKKAQVPQAIGWFWTLTGGLIILFVVSLASLPPRPVPKYLTQSVADEDVPEDELKETVASSSEDWGGMSKKISMQLEKEERDRQEMKKGSQEKTGAGSEGKRQPQDQGSDASSGSGQTSGKAATTSTTPPSSKPSSPSRDRSAERMRRPAPPSSLPLGWLEEIGKVLFAILIAIGALIALWKLFSLAAGASLLGATRKRLENLMRGLRSFLRPQRLLLPKKKARAALEKSNLYMKNPFHDPQFLRSMSKAELVRYTYIAFENFARIHGHVPETGQTPNEFFERLPPDFRLPETTVLLKLFMIAEYSTHAVPDESLKRLREVWTKIEV